MFRADINAICPYFTMYPLEFPLRVLSGAKEDSWVLDPFCGRGTTNLAARIKRLPSVGFDSSPVAAAIASAKLANTTIEDVVNCAERILNCSEDPSVPEGDFWTHAFSETTLVQLCMLRQDLLDDCSTPERIVLRAILLGALHGPKTKSRPSYFSNQCPRTFAPKPAYSVRFWKERKLSPPVVDVLEVVLRRAERYLRENLPNIGGQIHQRDSRNKPPKSLEGRCSWVVTSPPYYGMRTYIQDQWLRFWFLGGPEQVDYRQRGEDFDHGSPDQFSEQLRKVWKNSARMCVDGAKLICRFGGIHDRKYDCLDILKSSLRETGWRITTIKPAGTALHGRRQAAQFGASQRETPREEYDLYAALA